MLISGASKQISPPRGILIFVLSTFRSASAQNSRPFYLRRRSEHTVAMIFIRKTAALARPGCKAFLEGYKDLRS